MAGQNCAFFETKFVLSLGLCVDTQLIDAFKFSSSKVLSMLEVGFTQKRFFTKGRLVIFPTTMYLTGAQSCAENV